MITGRILNRLARLQAGKAAFSVYLVYNQNLVLAAKGLLVPYQPPSALSSGRILLKVLL